MIRKMSLFSLHNILGCDYLSLNLTTVHFTDSCSFMILCFCSSCVFFRYFLRLLFLSSYNFRGSDLEHNSEMVKSIVP